MHAKSTLEQEYIWKVILLVLVDYESISAFIIFLLAHAQERNSQTHYNTVMRNTPRFEVRHRRAVF